jgi:hypothetical protein
MEFKNYGLVLSLRGTHSATIDAGQTLNIDYQVTEDIVITGCDYKAVSCNMSDKITFQIVHPIAGVLNEFATDIFVRDYRQYSFYRAVVPTGLIIRVVYKNNGANQVAFNANMEMHKYKV